MKSFRRRVTTGSQTGQKIGFPTVNLNVGNFAQNYRPGVYACNVTVRQKEYRGALFFGPKTNHRVNILEIHIIRFSGQIYGQFITFAVGRKIREPKVFPSLTELKRQIEEDVKNI